MSLVNDFFIATPEELAALDTRSGPWPAPPEPPKKRWWSRDDDEATSAPAAAPGPTLPVVEAKGILDVELATLERILHGESVNDVDAVVELIEDPIRQEPADQPEAWISPLSERLVTALAASDQARLSAAVRPWLETEEMAQTGWDESAVSQLLTELSGLCRRGRAEQRGVYRWFSL